MRLESYVNVRVGIIACAVACTSGIVGCGSGDPADGTEGASGAATTASASPLPVMHGDGAWLECDDGTLAMSVYEHRGSGGADRVTQAQLVVGANVYDGTVDDSGKTSLLGAGSTYTGSASIDYTKNTVDLQGTLSAPGQVPSSYSISKTLSCTRLGADWDGNMLPAPSVAVHHGDSTWLVCDSATVLATVLEHRTDADQRSTSLGLIVAGRLAFSGTIASSRDPNLAVDGAFKGSATVDYDENSPSLTLAGVLTVEGTRYDASQTVACKRLYSDL